MTAYSCAARYRRLGPSAVGLVHRSSQSCSNDPNSVLAGNRRTTPLTNTFFEEGRNPCENNGDLLHALQFREASPNLESHPAMAAGVTSKLSEMSDMVKVREDREAGDLEALPRSRSKG